MVALVTGGASGIGRASALALAGAGADVAVVDVANEEAEHTAALVRDAGRRALALRVDVTAEAQVADAIARIVGELGGLDLAHNNAGTTGVPTSVETCSEEEWDRVVDLNLKAVWLCMKHEIPAMRDRGGGAIVNTASGAGLIGFPGLPAYVASKHGVVGLTKTAALELARSNIRVNAVCPGTTLTPMIQAYIGGDPARERLMLATCPNGRMADPAEIAAAVVWLLSPAASYVSGVALPVDYGAVAQ
jgi:NAD(P)-dependent dehydrogenase (short-subunit alcohol dehydrogenase family)